MKLITNLLSSIEMRRCCVIYRNKLYRTAYAWCHDTQLADDLVQETLYKALKSWRSLRDPEAIEPWLFRILGNTWHDYLRSSGRTTDLEDIADDQASAPEAYHQGQIVDRVRGAVSSLPLPLREVVTLADFSGFTYAEIAQILDIPIGTVMSRLFRARRSLKSRLLDLNRSPASVIPIRRVK